MNEPAAERQPTENKYRPINIAAGLLAFALLTMLVPLPQPRMISNHTWRAEIVTSLFLFVTILVFYWREPGSFARLISFENARIKSVFLLLTAFAGWGLTSGIWAQASISAWHHTILWIEYLLFFLIARERTKNSGSLRFISGAFLWISGIIGVLCIIDYVTVPDFKALEGVLRARYSSYAELLVAALPIVWAAAVYTRKNAKYYPIMLAGIAGWVAVMLSLSKGAFIAGVIAFGVMFAGSFLFGLKRFRPRLLASLGIWVVVTIAVQVGFSLLTPIPSTVDYISGKADATRESSIARIFVWRVGGQMVKDHWLAGVGADNFGVAFNPSRERFRSTHPDDPEDEIVADNLVERSHNELLQITAELGIVGLALIAAALLSFAVLLIQTLSANRFRMSPMFWAALGGMTGFGFSSMVSSFSLRIVQNGIVFFIAFAVAAHEIATANRKKELKRSKADKQIPLFAAVSFLLILSLTTLGLKGWAEYTIFAADRETDAAKAVETYHRAIRLDPDYQAGYLRSSGRSYVDKDYATAAIELRKAIDGGLGVVLSYSALAECYEKTGDTAAAERTFAESLRIYPRSIFLRIRYSKFLRDSSRTGDADAQFDLAKSIDQRQATGWNNLLTIGSVAAFYAAQTDPTTAPPAELLPEAAVLQYLDKPPGDDNAK